MKTILFTTGAIALIGIGVLVAEVKTDYDHATDFAHWPVLGDRRG